MIEDALPTLRQDPVMAALIEKHEPYTEPAWSEYERLCLSIINQQLSTASARAVRERVFDVVDHEVTPERILAAPDQQLREAGLSRQKLAYLKNAARAFQTEDFSRAGLSDTSNEAVIEKLTAIKGVGEWTARMYLLFVLEREDILPLGDLAVRRGIEGLYGDGEELTRSEMREIAEGWRPYRSVATLYIWAEYEAT